MSASARGGPGCSWKTIEQSTGVRIDHFVEIDYLGFEKSVGAVGGVNVCLPFTVNIPNDGLRLAYLITDSGFGLTAMYDLARSMQGTNLSKVQLIEAPVIPYPLDPMVRVIWQQPGADSW